MKGYAMLKIGSTGWVEKDIPKCGPLDAICKPIAIAPCTSDVHTVWEGAIGERDLTLAIDNILLKIESHSLRIADILHGLGYGDTCLLADLEETVDGCA